MADNPLLEALSASYGIALQPDTYTVRGLLRFAQGWLEGRVDAAELNDPCLAMAARLRAAAKATWADLEKNPDLSEESREPVQLTAEAYEAIADILDRLPLLAEDGSRHAFAEAMEEYEAERQVVLDATEEINYMMSGGELRCPRCGSSEDSDGRCPSCRLLLLYPDPKQLKDESLRSASLSPPYQIVYRAYVAVLRGEQSLETLLAILPNLEAHLSFLLQQCRRLSRRSDGAEALARIEAGIRASLQGIERMAGAEKSRKTSDLNRGWEDIFESALSMASAGEHYQQQIQ